MFKSQKFYPVILQHTLRFVVVPFDFCRIIQISGTILDAQFWQCYHVFVYTLSVQVFLNSSITCTIDYSILHFSDMSCPSMFFFIQLVLKACSCATNIRLSVSFFQVPFPYPPPCAFSLNLFSFSQELPMKLFFLPLPFPFPFFCFLVSDTCSSYCGSVANCPKITTKNITDLVLYFLMNNNKTQ